MYTIIFARYHCVNDSVNYVIDNDSMFTCIVFLLNRTFGAFYIETGCVIFWCGNNIIIYYMIYNYYIRFII